MSPLMRELSTLGACPEALVWALAYSDKTAKELWEQCVRPDWLMWLLIKKRDTLLWPTTTCVLSLLCDVVKVHTMPILINTPEHGSLKDCIDMSRGFLRNKFVSAIVTTPFGDIVFPSSTLLLADTLPILACTTKPDSHRLAMCAIVLTGHIVSRFRADTTMLYSAPSVIQYVVEAVTFHTGSDCLKESLVNVSNTIRNRVTVPL